MANTAGRKVVRVILTLLLAMAICSCSDAQVDTNALATEAETELVELRNLDPIMSSVRCYPTGSVYKDLYFFDCYYLPPGREALTLFAHEIRSVQANSN